MSSNEIYKRLADVMADIDAVGKSQKNAQQGYNFRGIDAVYNAIHPILAKHGIITVPFVESADYSEKPSKSGGTMIHVKMAVRYTFYAPDGSACSVGPIRCEAMDSSDKASNKALAFAHKYALLQTFCIPTEDVAEGDRETLEPAAKGSKLFDSLMEALKAAKNHQALANAEELIRKSAAKLTPIELDLLRKQRDTLKAELPA